ncbi:DUF4184 family protein [Lysinibacillus macroides]|uniref:DUF4184 family protein n=1 Tax=Lysinibacillus macroides TaxID=33935 RepID=A0A0M9DM44_9BACI|nr:DUF4184 family protein [Lysinibacillus macroides]KOY82952.1 hypothetical protein ADM90_06420 [Lysinibacillus macroides]QPR70201.1 DUF4184 family protein [Lysinibacillus macroides]
MPLTFAHPAAVLPFSRKSKYLHFSALVLGSMAPDFEYFVRGRPIAEIGHNLTGFFMFNLPLTILFYMIYRICISQGLMQHLPKCLQDTTYQPVTKSKLVNIIVFSYSALLGMLTHVFWDAFTHQHGFMVTTFPILSQTFQIGIFQIPVYKLLQHGSTLLGIALIIGYVYNRAAHSPKGSLPTIYPKQKFLFWLAVFGLTFSSIYFWYAIDQQPLYSYGVLVVRIVDAFFCSLLTVSLLTTYKRRCFE